MKKVDLFMMDSSSISRNTRGFSLPGCGCGVTDPISTNPKPLRNNPSTASACLSNPAATPNGFVSVKLKNLVFYSKMKIRKSYLIFQILF